MTASGMQRPADAAHAPAANGADVVGIDLQTHHLLLSFRTQVARHRPQRFGQHDGRAAVQQAKRLMSTVVYRHRRFQFVVANARELDIQQTDHVLRAHGI